MYTSATLRYRVKRQQNTYLAFNPRTVIVNIIIKVSHVFLRLVCELTIAEETFVPIDKLCM